MSINAPIIHKSITQERVTDAITEQMTSLSNPGFCHACGEDADGCEPDAEDYPCEGCDENAVYGAEQTLFML
jgi:hypothetical protein